MALVNACRASLSPGNDPRFDPRFCELRVAGADRGAPGRAEDRSGQPTRAASARRDVMSSFMKQLRRWYSTVFTDTYSSLATSLLVSPVATNRATASSDGST